MADNTPVKQWDGAVEIPLDQLVPEPLNPNTMSPKMFNELVSTIQEVGFDEPIQVAPLPDPPEGGPKYVIVGGEHRYRASRVLGFKTIPAVVKTDLTDEVQRRMLMVKRNIVRGELDKAKFATLVRDMEDRHKVERALLAKGMGFTTDQHFGRFFKEQKKTADAKLKKALEDSRKEMILVDNVAYVVSEIMAQSGGTVTAGWLFFAYKNKFHLMLQSSPELYQVTQVLAAWAKRDPEVLCEFMDAAIRAEMQKRGVPTEGLGPEADLTPTEPSDEPDVEDVPAEPYEVEAPDSGARSGGAQSG